MRSIRIAAIGAVALALGACTPQPTPSPPRTSASAPDATPSSPSPSSMTLATGLDAPWSVVPTEGGALISQRDDGIILELTPDGELREAGTVPDVVAGGEGGLLGIALHDGWLYAYHGAEDDNRVVRMPLSGEPGSLTVGTPEPVFTGIPRSTNHNGGRIAFGPDGMLYVATGDAGQRDRAQNRDDLGGKILRLTPEGNPAPGNPFDSAVYSLGHRNVQGLAWDADGTLWASEFGQNTWDELNRIEPGGNYGWPLHEGVTEADGFIDPVVQWAPDEASPSGIAVIDGTLFVAGLRGERLWVVDRAAPAEAWAAFTGEYGRLRDVVPGPDGSLWVLTNNTDGRGDPGPDDDRLLQLTLPEG